MDQVYQHAPVAGLSCFQHFQLKPISAFQSFFKMLYVGIESANSSRISIEGVARVPRNGIQITCF